MAQGFNGTAAGESFIYSLSPRARQYILKLVFKKISKSEATISIETAGDDGSVYQYSHLIAESVAKGVGVAPFKGGIIIRPIKSVSPFKKDLVSHSFSISSAYGCPFIGKLGMKTG